MGKLAVRGHYVWFLAIVTIFRRIGGENKFIGIKSLSTKQCSAELSPWIVPPIFAILPKIFLSFNLACCPHHVWISLTLTPNLCGKPFKWGQNPAQQQKLAYFPHQKSPPQQIATFMYLPNTSFIYSFIAVVIAIVSFFFFLASDFRHSYITLILINPWLLNLIFSLRKALNGKIHSIKILNHRAPPPSLPFNAIFKTLLQLLLVFLFIPYNYHFKLYKFLLTPLQLWAHILRPN